MEDFDAFMSGMSLLSEVSGLTRSMSKNRWFSTLKTLESGPHVEQLLTLSELSSFLSYANEDSLLGFPSWNYMRVLMHTIKSPEVKYCTVKAKVVEETPNPEEMRNGETMPFYELINAIYTKKAQVGEQEADIVPPSEEASSLPTDRKNDQNPSEPAAPNEEVSIVVDNEPISEEMAANKAITAASCLNTLLDILPHATGFFMSNPKQLAILKDKLQDIQYIDLAEIILLIYEKLVKEIPITVVKSKSLVAMLEFVDFFPTDVQVGTYTSIMKAVKKIERPESCKNYLIPLIPYLSQSLQSGNKKIVQLSCIIWKVIVTRCVRAHTKCESGTSDVISHLVSAALSSNAVNGFCKVIFSEQDRLSRIHVNQGLYCLAVLANESNEAVSRILDLGVLPYVARSLGHSFEDTLVRLVDLGLAIMGSYLTTEPLTSDVGQLYQRSEYFLCHTEQLKDVVATFPIAALLHIYEGTISQNLRNRIMILQWRLIELAAQTEQCRNLVMNDLPFHRLIEAVCYSLRYHNHDEQCEVAIHLVICLFKLMDHDTIVDALMRHGLSALLESVKSQKLEHEISYILQQLPPMDVTMADKPGIELIHEMKSRGNTMTVFELTNSGLLSLDYDELLSERSLKHLIKMLVLCDQGYRDLNSQTVDIEGIRTLWRTFYRFLETQPEFMLNRQNTSSGEEPFSNDSRREKTLERMSSTNDVEMITDSIDETNDAQLAEASAKANEELLDIIKSDKAMELLNVVDVDAEDAANECIAISSGGDQESSQENNSIDSSRPELSLKQRLKTLINNYNKSGISISSESGLRLQKEQSMSQDSEAEDFVGRVDNTYPLDMLLGLYGELSGSQSKSSQEEDQTGTFERRNRPKRLDSRSRRSSHHSGRERNRFKGALGMFRQLTKRDTLPFPLSCADRDVKLKLKCLNKEDELKVISTIAVYTSPFVAVAKVESYILGYVNNRLHKQDDGSATAPKKRSKVNESAQADGDRKYSSIQIYYKGMPLAPTVPMYQVLFALRGRDDKHIWEESNVLNFEVISLDKESELQRLQSGRYTPLVTSLCENRHSVIELYMDFLCYVRRNGGPTLDARLAKLKEKLIALEENEAPSKVQCVLDKVRCDHMQSSTVPMTIEEENMAEDMAPRFTTDAVQGMEVSTDEPIATHETAENDSAPLEYISRRVACYMERMAMMWSGETECDPLVASAPICSSPDELSDESRRHVRMMVFLNSLITELEVFMRDSEINPTFSKRLTLKLLTLLGKLEQSLCYRMPKWIIKLVVLCPSLFSLESRRVLFDILATGPQRVLAQFASRLSSLIDSDVGAGKESDNMGAHALDEVLRQGVLSRNNVKLGALQDIEGALKIPKVKSICSREDIILDAMHMMDQVISISAELDSIPKLEIEFENEVGVGSGPTQEFYSLLVEAIVNFTTEEGTIMENLGGYLYPSVRKFSSKAADEIELDLIRRPSQPESDSESDKETEPLSAFTFKMFRLLGQICASALIDKKLLSMTMHPLFWLLCQQPNAEPNCSLAALRSLDPALAKFLENLGAVEDLEDSGLFFSYNDIPLVPGGEGIKLTKDNLPQFIKAVVKLRLYEGVRMQVWAFRMGFAMILPLEALSLFTPSELADHVFGVKDQSEYWTVEHLQKYIIPDHGYDASSTTYIEFIKTLASLSEEGRRQFLKFCTGAPVLPKGGFAGLSPIMKVVKKGDGTDALPSVMTCSNYLKLPAYQSSDQIREKLIKAIGYGQGSFNLS
ncbi:hypothetical protein BgAZ_100500 [Babesia gibsoni]|uniref:HECT domain-containing protein n=1 Tax=Babesia gibsoni TaxID=33632 RepID=A0AAD8PF44_BABGI|nr:hypothetical protein BgAZ_100500 [Babesia gibsoni]